jgi:hypothetical protein
MPAQQYDPRFPYRTELDHPVVGLESEFVVWIDEQKVVPEEVWKTPSGFIQRPLLSRSNKSSQLPTGGAVYFDGGVLEVVTPVVEIGPQCTARVVRSLWEQVGFIREELDAWERRTGHRVRLEAFSCHFNISFELARDERSRDRTIQKLALLLAHLLPVPAIVTGANRRSTGVGVRPRRERIEITFDFTPDPGLMSATAALLVGVIREVITWPSYRVEEAISRGLPFLEGVEPGKHVTRKGWLTKDYHYPRSPFTSDIDEESWTLRDGRVVSLRAMALEIATYFRDSIRRHSDPFSYRLLFSVLSGETPSLLDLRDRPAAYDDVGRQARWAHVIPELDNFESLMLGDSHLDLALGQHLASRETRRAQHAQQQETTRSLAPQARRRRVSDVTSKLVPPWSGEPADVDRRQDDAITPSDRRRGDRRRAITEEEASTPLSRSAYESVFIRLGTGAPLEIGGQMLQPLAVKGWYHALFRTPEGEERMLSIDQLVPIVEAEQKIPTAAAR